MCQNAPFRAFYFGVITYKLNRKNHIIFMIPPVCLSDECYYTLVRYLQNAKFLAIYAIRIAD